MFRRNFFYHFAGVSSCPALVSRSRLLPSRLNQIALLLRQGEAEYPDRWGAQVCRALTKSARKLIADTGNLILVSAASAWEIATKVGLGKLPAGVDLVSDFAGQLKREGFEMLAISWDHAIRAGSLAGPHRDPFDRMLIAQAQAEKSRS